MLFTKWLRSKLPTKTKEAAKWIKLSLLEIGTPGVGGDICDITLRNKLIKDVLMVSFLRWRYGHHLPVKTSHFPSSENKFVIVRQIHYLNFVKNGQCTEDQTHDCSWI